MRVVIIACALVAIPGVLCVVYRFLFRLSIIERWVTILWFLGLIQIFNSLTFINIVGLRPSESFVHSLVFFYYFRVPPLIHLALGVCAIGLGIWLAHRAKNRKIGQNKTIQPEPGEGRKTNSRPSD